MNKDEFGSITAEVIEDILDDMSDKGISAASAVAVTLTMTMLASKLKDRLFGESDSLEIERER